MANWIGEAERRFRQQTDALSAYYRNNPVTIDSSKPRGYKTIAIEHTCIPDTTYPWDPEVVKKLWEFDNRLVPMWVRFVLQEPNSDRIVVVGRHAVGIHIPNPNADLPKLDVTMPEMPCQGVTLGKPHALAIILQGEPPPGDYPGEYIPLSMKIYYDLKQGHDEMQNKSAKEIAREIIEGRREQREKERLALQDEHDYRMRDIRKLAQKKLDEVSEVEAKEQLLAGRQRVVKPLLDLRR